LTSYREPTDREFGGNSMARRVGKCINGCPSEQEIIAHGMRRTCYNKARRDRKAAVARCRRYEGRGLTKELESLVKLR
jgi:hypothetical protein